MPSSSAILLTDPPHIVRLKQEFFRLDTRVEQLRPFQHHAAARAELARLETRKQEIATEIFSQRNEP
jgi:hypothetical protein